MPSCPMVSLFYSLSLFSLFIVLQTKTRLILNSSNVYSLEHSKAHKEYKCFDPYKYLETNPYFSTHVLKLDHGFFITKFTFLLVVTNTFPSTTSKLLQVDQ